MEGVARSHSKVRPHVAVGVCYVAPYLCCRVTEVLMLKRRDIDTENGVVYVGPLKHRGETRKCLSQAAQQILAKWMQEGGVTVQRTRKCGARGLQTIHDRWEFPAPEDGKKFLFPSRRSDAKKKQMTKDRSSKIV